MSETTHGYAVLVNAKAKRGGRRVAVQINKALPGSSVRLTTSRREITSWLQLVRRTGWPRRAILSAGGDGTVVALITALREVLEPGEPFPLIGILPLGTGNGWAYAVGAPKLDRCLHLLEDTRAKLPVRRFGVFETTSPGLDTRLAHFAGSGFDAGVLEDYKQQLAESKGPAVWFSKSVYGYVAACFLRTAPRAIIKGNPTVKVENLDGEAWMLTSDRRLVKVHDARPGTVLFEGPAGSAAVGTSPTFGYGFRAFPFAERFPNMINVRVYERTALGAVAHAQKLWSGAHPLEGMNDFFTRAVRFTFSREVPLQVGGDAMGMVTVVEYRIEPRSVPVVDWRSML